jgi:hypothetical protein
MRETLDIETVLQSAAVDFRQALKLGEAEIRLGNPTSLNQKGNGSNHNEPAT